MTEKLLYEQVKRHGKYQLCDILPAILELGISWFELRCFNSNCCRSCFNFITNIAALYALCCTRLHFTTKILLIHDCVLNQLNLIYYNFRSILQIYDYLSCHNFAHRISYEWSTVLATVGQKLRYQG